MTGADGSCSPCSSPPRRWPSRRCGGGWWRPNLTRETDRTALWAHHIRGWGRVVVVALVVLKRRCPPRRAPATASVRDSNRALTDLTLSVDAPTVIRIPRHHPHLPRRALPGPDWLSADLDNADDAFALLRPGRTEPVAVVGNGADQVRAPGYDRRPVAGGGGLHPR